MVDSFDVVFHGNSESECIDFIRVIRQHAKEKADELFNAFSGKAFKWYVRLSADVRGDWELLQQALVTRWLTDDDNDDTVSPPNTSIIPTAAAAPAAPLPNLTPGGSSPPNRIGRVGRVRIRCKDRQEERFLSKGLYNGPKKNEHGSFYTTTEERLALKVRLRLVTSSTYRLELVDHDSGLSVLAAFNFDSQIWSSGTSWGLLVPVDSPGQGSLKDRRTTLVDTDDVLKHEFWTDSWTLHNDRDLKLIVPADPAAECFFFLSRKGDDRDCLWFRCSSLNTGPSFTVVEHLEFEPLDG